MQSLQEYLIENIDEGKIWDSIKDWFKSLFDSKSNKQYSRYVDVDDENYISGSNLNNYKSYLKDNFDKNDIKLKDLTDVELKKVVFPGGVEPSKEYDFGFYDFIDYKNDEYYKESNYIGLLYNNDDVSDTSALVQIKYNDEELEIIKLQIINEFENILSISDIINMIIKNKEIINNCKFITVNETINKNLYNKVINDCKFKKEYDDKSKSNIGKLEVKTQNNKSK